MNASQSESHTEYFDRPISRVVEPVIRYLHVEAASGAVLLGCALIALIWANTPGGEGFIRFWDLEIGLQFGSLEFSHSIKHWINDGLMALFFFVVGLEVKREFALGELREFRKAILPIGAAIGGMVVPAVLYLVVIGGHEGQRGWGIPMATDIAFVIGCLAVLGPRVPPALRVFMLSLAIADDLGAIAVVAFGYTEHISWLWLLGGLAGIGIISFGLRLGIRSIPVYCLIGIAIWFSFFESGIHGTIAGVILGLMTPARSYLSQGFFSSILRRAAEVFEGGEFDSIDHRAEKVRRLQRLARETISPIEYLQYLLHPWSSFVIMPVFALANACVPFRPLELAEPVSLAVIVGLSLGKPLGIATTVGLLAVLGWARLPDGCRWRHIWAGGCLAGIGFTMSMFIAGLALPGEQLDHAKVGVMVGSALSAFAGITILLCGPKPQPTDSIGSGIAPAPPVPRKVFDDPGQR